MSRLAILYVLLHLLVASLPDSALAIDGDGLKRFVARRANGQRVEGEVLAGWGKQGGAPTLDGQPLLGDNPMHWLLDRGQAPPLDSARGARIELWQGDVLPGDVISYVQEKSLPATPGHFLVACSAELQPPPAVNDAPVRIVRRWVKRIVFHSTDAPQLEPGSLRLRDGRLLRFRSIRVEADQVVVLTASGRASANWSELSEICFSTFQSDSARPSASSSSTSSTSADRGTTDSIEADLTSRKRYWEPHWEQLASLAPSGDARLLELHTSDHLSVTATFDRMAHRDLSKNSASESWVHGVQPAWSLDALWIPSRRVWLRIAYPIHQLLLSRLTPTAFEHRPMVGVHRRWRRDRSVRGEPLLAGQGPFGWGVGVHSHSRLTYRLPAAALKLHGEVALDSTAGKRGCVLARVLLGDKAVFRSKHLVGDAIESYDVDLVAGRAGSDTVELHLEIDAAHDGRPSDADPLDIRDQTNWLDPIVEFDPEWVAEECQLRAARQVDAWRSWSFWSPQPVQWVTEWDTLATPPGAFTTRLESEHELILARRISRRESQRYLILSVSNSDTKQPATLHVHCDGRLLLQTTVPERSPRSPAVPLTVAPLDSLPIGEERDLVVAISSPEKVSLRWHAALIAGAHPEYLELYDDQPHEQAVELRQRAYTGDRYFRLTPGKPLRYNFNPPMEFRYRPAPSQCRHLRFAASTDTKGLLAIRIKVKGEDEPALYDVGQGPLTERRARRIIPQALSKNWLPVNRDICIDLMEADVEWIEFFVPKGMGEVLLDQCFVGRGGGGAWNDLETPLEGVWNNPEERRRLAEALAPRVGAGVVSIQYADGRLAEGVVLDETHILTLGETVPTDVGEARVTLPDGKQSVGKVLGVDRENNWGLIQWTGKDKLPPPPPRADGGQTIPYNSAMLEVGVNGRGVTPLSPSPAPGNEIRSLAPVEIKDSVLGRPLVTAAGQVVGLRASTTATRYVTLTNFGRQFGILKKPERIGAWRLGQGPALGMTIRWIDSGARVTSVTNAAQSAGIESGDLLLEVNGKAVRDAWTAHHAIREMDPGQELKVVLQHGDDEPREVTLRLGFRKSR